MKELKFIVLVLSITLAIVSCKNKTEDRYINLDTGKEVELVKDDSTGLWVDVDTRKPVRLYVDTRTNDTIYGTTGKVINGKITRSGDGVYIYTDESDNTDNTVNSTDSYEHKDKNKDLKVEVEKDGDIKIKDGNQKIKIDGETGEKKVKND